MAAEGTGRGDQAWELRAPLFKKARPLSSLSHCLGNWKLSPGHKLPLPIGYTPELQVPLEFQGGDL